MHNLATNITLQIACSAFGKLAAVVAGAYQS
jgi:hypothetical protein